MFVELDDKQLEAIDNLRTGKILCGGVGSGKSRTAIGYYFKTCGGDIRSDDPMMHGQVKKLYIITTAKKRDLGEWLWELPPFLLSEEDGLYPGVVVDSWNNIGKYMKVKDAFFIFDEQHVSGTGKWTGAFLKIAKANEWILLSATPGDKWEDYIPVFIANGFYRGITDFKEQHIIFSPYVKYPKVLRYVNVGKLLRERESLLVDIDIKRHTVQHHEYINTEFDKQKYLSMILTRWNPYTNEPFKTAGELCVALRKVSSQDPSRQQALLELIEHHERVVIFYNFKSERDILKSLYYGPDVAVAEWNGQHHQPVPDTEKWVYLVQYTAGSEGWNCAKTDTMIFFSDNYSYRIMVQSCGRIDRRDSPYTDLYYYHLVSRSPIEQTIQNAIKRKKKFNERGYAEKLGFIFRKEDENVRDKNRLEFKESGSAA